MEQGADSLPPITHAGLVEPVLGFFPPTFEKDQRGMNFKKTPRQRYFFNQHDFYFR
jgi:hypothetical protein